MADAGTTEPMVNVMDPSTGEVGSLPQSAAQQAIAQNIYIPASDDDTQKFVQRQKYGTLPQQLLTGAEAAGESSTFGASDVLEKGLSKIGVPGLTDEDRLQRAAENPLSHMGGSGVGLVGSSLLGVGEGAALSHLGEAGASALGLGEASSGLARIGSLATKSAIENMGFQAGDETSKWLSNDPGQTMDTAAADIGLSGLLGAGIGGGLGVISPLWNATAGPKVSQFLQMFENKLGGVEGQAPDAVDQLIHTSELNLSPSTIGAIKADPSMRQFASDLQDSLTGSAQEFQQGLNAARSDASDQILNTFGKTPTDIPQIEKYSLANAGDQLRDSLSDEIGSKIQPALEEQQAKQVFNENADKGMLAALGKTSDDIDEFKNSSHAELGQNFGNTLAEEYKNISEPIKSTYDELQSRYSKIPLQDAFGLMGKLQNVLTKYEEDPNSPQFQLIKKLMDVVPNIKSLEGLRNIRSSYAAQADSQQLWDVSKAIKSNLFNHLDQEIGRQVAEESPELIGKFQGVQNAYADLMNKTEFLNDRLHVGRYNGPGTFLNSLKEMVQERPESLVNRLDPKADASLIRFTQENFPKTAEAIKDYQLNKMIGKSSARTSGIQAIDPDALYTNMDKLSPEMKKFILPEGAQEAISSIKQGIDSPVSAEYLQASDFLTELNKRLRLGKFEGPQEFLDKLSNMAPENLMRRLSKGDDAELLQMLSQNGFDRSSAAIKDFKINDLLKDSLYRLQGHESPSINLKNFFGQVKNMSPEWQQFLLPEGSSDKLNAMEALLQKIPSKINFSGTAPVFDKLNSIMPSGMGAMLGFLTGHSPLLGAMLGTVGRYVSREAPDAIKLALLKRMGSSAPADAGGFKAAVDFIHASLKGETLAGKASKALFKAGQEVLPQGFMPTDREKTKLDDHLKTLQTNPNPLMNVGGKTSYYLPDHGQALAQRAATSVNYLNSLRPSPSKQSPLDAEPLIPKAQKTAYDRALTIAEQPLSVLPKVKDGSITPQDLQHLNTLYPGLLNHLKQTVSSEMANHLSDGGKIPYKTRMGLSLLLGQPLDSTLTPQGIQAAQATFQQNASPTQPAPQARGGAGHSMKALSKISEIDQLPSQARQAAKVSQH